MPWLASAFISSSQLSPDVPAGRPAGPVDCHNVRRLAGPPGCPRDGPICFSVRPAGRRRPIDVGQSTGVRAISSPVAAETPRALAGSDGGTPTTTSPIACSRCCRGGQSGGRPQLPRVQAKRMMMFAMLVSDLAPGEHTIGSDKAALPPPPPPDTNLQPRWMAV